MIARKDEDGSPIILCEDDMLHVWNKKSILNALKQWPNSNCYAVAAYFEFI